MGGWNTTGQKRGFAATGGYGCRRRLTRPAPRPKGLPPFPISARPQRTDRAAYRHGTASTDGRGPVRSADPDSGLIQIIEIQVVVSVPITHRMQQRARAAITQKFEKRQRRGHLGRRNFVQQLARLTTQNFTRSLSGGNRARNFHWLGGQVDTAPGGRIRHFDLRMFDPGLDVKMQNLGPVHEPSFPLGRERQQHVLEATERPLCRRWRSAGVHATADPPPTKRTAPSTGTARGTKPDRCAGTRSGFAATLARRDAASGSPSMMDSKSPFSRSRKLSWSGELRSNAISRSLQLTVMGGMNQLSPAPSSQERCTAGYSRSLGGRCAHFNYKASFDLELRCHVKYVSV